ncbi:MAG: hypothetical protein JWO83_4903 [Caulobacteraceae bacterium]|nr:hypothetical protein [Caulobacteraceae bacterium]
MAIEERLSRSPPARPGPRRALLPEVEAVNGMVVGVGGRPAPDDTIGHAVDAAYRVVEENIEEGRRAAERLRGAGHPATEGTPGARALAGRLMHMTRELGGAWVDLVVALVNEPEVRAAVDRMTSHDRARAAAPSPSPAGSATSVIHRVSSRKPVELTLSPLPALGPGAVPAIAGLHALDPATPAITQVAFTRRPDDALELAIAIPDDQPADTYWGTLVDLTSRQPIGTLTVRVLE